MQKITRILFAFILSLVLTLNSYGVEKPTRVGTAAADFLTIGFGTSGTAMGDAFVSAVNDISAIYWNPAGLAKLEHNEAIFVQQPWLVGINTAFAAVGFRVPSIGTMALGLIYADYGEMEVTTMDFQDGTGEHFDAKDLAFSFSYGRNLTNWFAVGFSGKYIASQIWHTSASAIAADLGIQINTTFFSPSGRRKDGMVLGMSISNYGTRMRYDGIDLLNPIDIDPNHEGNFRDVPGQFRLQEWELPLIFRLGVAVHPILTENHKLTLAIDALHPNNNAESVNIGAQYAFKSPGIGKVFFRTGYKALFMPQSQYGWAFGFGLEKNLIGNTGFRIEYAFREVGILGNVHSYGVSILF